MTNRMANKIALLLLAAIIVTATGAGAALGIYVSGSGSLADLAGGGDGDQATPTPAPDGGNAGGGGDQATATPAPTATPTPTPTPTPTENPAVWTDTPTPTATPTPETVPPESFDESNIEALVADEINDRRAEIGKDSLRTLPEIDRMAANHSRRMAAQRYASHAAGGYTTEERYRRNDLQDRCRMPDDTNTGIRDGSDIETVTKVSAGSELDGRNNRDDSEVASAAVENWFAQEAEREKLVNRNAETLGIGVVVTGENRAYVTVDLCS